MRKATLLTFASLTLLLTCSCKNQNTAAARSRSHHAISQPDRSEPTDESPVAEAPTDEQAMPDQPGAETPNGEQPTAEAPTGEQPGTDQPTADAAEKPTGEAPTAEAPTAEQPGADEPTAEVKPTSDPAVEAQPTVEPPAAEQPKEEPKEEPKAQPEPAFGSIERLDPALDQIIAPGTKIEKLAEGLDWAEGPLWQRSGGVLLFSDVPQNVIFKWEPADGTVSPFLKPSGYTGTTPRGGEMGSNGLTFDAEGRLVICQHGDRRIVRVEHDGKWTTLADKFDGKRFNSPNDLCFDSKGNLYFTDPSYGLEGKNDDPKKELNFNGVYMLRKNGRLVLLTKGMTFPNGIALSPDERTLYVNQSDPKQPIIRSFEIKPDGTLTNARVFFDASALAATGKGLPDGLKVDERGNVFSTGPGGVLIISPTGKHLGTINTGQATANCAWGGDGSDLYITADMYICRVKTETRGKMPG